MIAREGKSVNIISNQQKNATIITYFIPHILLGDFFKIVFASMGDCLELFASEGDFVTSTGYSICSVTSMAGD